MNDMMIFTNPEFGSVRTVTINGKIYFSGTDVAKALGYSKPQDAVSRHCRRSVKHGGVSETTNIARTGKYEVSTKQDSYQIEDPIERAKRWIEEQQEKQQLETKVKEQKPKADYFDSLVDNRLLTTFRDTAKEFHIPPKAFTKWLAENGYIYRDRHNIIKPYESYRKAGLFQHHLDIPMFRHT